MSWRAQSRSKDAKTPSVGRVMSENPEPGSWPIQPYCGAGIYGYNSEELEKMCAGLGEFAETVFSGFGTMDIKFMVYTANTAVFPLHARDSILCNSIYFEFRSPFVGMHARFRNVLREHQACL